MGASQEIYFRSTQAFLFPSSYYARLGTNPNKRSGNILRRIGVSSKSVSGYGGLPMLACSPAVRSRTGSAPHSGNVFYWCLFSPAHSAVVKLHCHLAWSVAYWPPLG